MVTLDLTCTSDIGRIILESTLHFMNQTKRFKKQVYIAPLSLFVSHDFLSFLSHLLL